MRNTKRYLDDLDAQGVIVRVAALVEGKAQRLLPVDGDAVQVVVGQGQPYLQMGILLMFGVSAFYAAQYKCFGNDSMWPSQEMNTTFCSTHAKRSLFFNDILWKMC